MPIQGTKSCSALGRGCSSSPSPARCRDQMLAITPHAAAASRAARSLYLLHTIAPQPAVPQRLGTGSAPCSGLLSGNERGRSPLRLLQPPPGSEARERSQLITWMRPARAGAGRGGRDFARAAGFKGVSAPRSCTPFPIGCKISRGPHGATPDPQPAGREAVGPTITQRRRVSAVLPQWWYPRWEGQGVPMPRADPSPRLTRSTLTLAIAPPPGPRAL